MSQINGFLQNVRAIDPDLASILPERDSVKRVLERLGKTVTGDLLVDESFERRRLWQDAGLYYMHNQRLYDSIVTFLHLYNSICDEQRRRSPRWLHKGMPLVWIAECYMRLGYQYLSARYLILTGVSDAISAQGRLDPNSGFYFRARWHRGWADEDIERFYADCWAAYDVGDELCDFPEHVLLKVEVPFPLPYATPPELNRYEVNRFYASRLLDVVKDKRNRKLDIDGKDLERLAALLLGAIPGFEIKAAFASKDTQYDGLIRNIGPQYDYRSDLGTYVPIECKDWNHAVGVPEIAQFINKLVMQDCRSGILFSSQGVTGEGKNQFAELQLLKAHYRAGKVILVLNEHDFRQAGRGENLISMLRQKYEEIRFDLRSST